MADDSNEVRAMVSHCLETWGLHVMSVGTGREALTLLRHQYFDLIVTDIVMPDADGIEVVADVRKRYRSTRILAMCGDTGRLAAEYCLGLARKMGAHGALEKPFTVAQLREAVRQIAPEPWLETSDFPGLA